MDTTIVVRKIFKSCFFNEKSVFFCLNQLNLFLNCKWVIFHLYYYYILLSIDSKQILKYEDT